MSADAIVGLDHVLIGVRDLDLARADFARLGFDTCPRGRHIGWGTANHCVMLPDDYVELLGIVDPNLFTNHLDHFLEKEGEGLLGLALATSDPDATLRAWRTAGFESAEIRPLKRLLDSPEGVVEVSFCNVMLDNAETAGLRIFACHHETPELMRRPSWLRHPSTARHVSGLTLLTDDPVAVSRTLEPLLAAGSATWTDDVAALHSGSCVILIATPADATLLHPAFDLGDDAPTPRLAVMEIEVADIEAAARFLDLQDMAHVRGEGGVISLECTGVAIEMRPTTRRS